MVLAAGLGERMRPLTELIAKPALPVLNRPLLHWTLEHLASHGVREVVINLHHLPRTIRRVVGNGRAFGLAVRYSNEAEILGTGGGPRKLRRFLGDEPFLLVNGDVIFDFDLTALVRAHRRSRALATLALRPNPDPSRYSPVVTARDGRVLSIAGRPRAARGTASLFTGVHVMDPAVLDRLPLGPSDSVRDAYFPMLGAGERIQGLRVKGAWYDFGSPALYLRSHAAILASGLRGRAGARRVIDPTAKVSTTARIVGSVVGPGCVVEAGATVTGSVLWNGVRVGERSEVRDSILTSRVTVTAGQRHEGVTWIAGRRPEPIGAPS
jgi:mannose-1-phosphate guanylyltransferase